MKRLLLAMAIVAIAAAGCTTPATDPAQQPTPQPTWAPTLATTLEPRPEPTPEPKMEPTLEPTPEPTSEANPEAVVSAAMEAWNAGDVGALKALFAGDAVVCFPDWGDECTTGAEELAAWIEELVAVHFAIGPESIEAERDIVTVVANVWADPTRDLGIAPLVTTDVYTVRDDRIVGQTSTLTEESAVKLAEAMAALASQPQAVVTAYVEAINAGDLDAAMGLCHEDLYADLLPTLLPEVQNLFGGNKEDVRSWLEEAMALHLEVEMEVISEAGDKVAARSKIWSDHLEALDAAPIVVNEVFGLREGQIKSWSRTITASSTRRLLEGLARTGIAATFVPEAGESLVSQASDIAGIWGYTLIGESAELELDPDGDFYIRGPSGKVGNTAEYWFEEGLLLIETNHASETDYCGDSTGGYVVFVNRAGDKPAKLRVHRVFDLCDLRSGALTGGPLTMEDEG